MTRILVDDPDVVDRLGIDHYYQIALFTEDSQHNPLVFCVRELPAGMPTGAGPQFAESITVAGFFFNTWAYRSRQRANAAGARSAWRLAPLLIGREPIWRPRRESSRNPLVAAIAGGLFILLLVGVWLALWRWGRGDRRFRDRTLSGPLGTGSGVAPDELRPDAEGPPDFSGLTSPGEDRSDEARED